MCVPRTVKKLSQLRKTGRKGSKRAGVNLESLKAGMEKNAETPLRFCGSPPGSGLRLHTGLKDEDGAWVEPRPPPRHDLRSAISERVLPARSLRGSPLCVSAPLRFSSGFRAATSHWAQRRRWGVGGTPPSTETRSSICDLRKSPSGPLPPKFPSSASLRLCGSPPGSGLRLHTGLKDEDGAWVERRPPPRHDLRSSISDPRFPTRQICLHLYMNCADGTSWG